MLLGQRRKVAARLQLLDDGLGEGLVVNENMAGAVFRWCGGNLIIVFGLDISVGDRVVLQVALKQRFAEYVVAGQRRSGS